jgi:hypothetical protein
VADEDATPILLQEVFFQSIFRPLEFIQHRDKIMIRYRYQGGAPTCRGSNRYVLGIQNIVHVVACARVPVVLLARADASTSCLSLVVIVVTMGGVVVVAGRNDHDNDDDDVYVAKKENLSLLWATHMSRHTMCFRKNLGF